MLGALVASITLPLALLLPAGAIAAPDPGGNERTNVRLPLERGFLGVNENLAATMSAESAAQALHQIGARVGRTTVSWDMLEREPGVWNETAWARLRHMNRELRKRGARMLAIIGFAPPWARETNTFPAPGQILPPNMCGRGRYSSCVYPPRREMDGRWRRFVREAVLRLPGAMFQTWNEPNWAGFWESGADPRRWAELHVAAWQEIKAIRPKARVVACGCATSGNDQEGAMPVRQFLLQAFAHKPSIKGRYDAIGVNIFPQRGAGAGRSFGAGTWFARALHNVRSALRQGAGRRAPIVITEVGLWTDGARAPVSEAEQARGLTRIVRRAATTRDIKGVILHRLQAAVWETAEERAMSLFEPGSGKPRPAWCWFASLAGRPTARGCKATKRPRASIRRGPPRSTRSRAAVLRFAKSPSSARLECAIGRRGFRPCGTRLALRGLRPGSHRVRVRAWRESGAQQRRPAVHRWRVRR